MPLELRYFVLKPKGTGPHHEASRRAMKTYAAAIREHDEKLAQELWQWAEAEEFNAGKAPEEPVAIPVSVWVLDRGVRLGDHLLAAFPEPGDRFEIEGQTYEVREVQRSAEGEITVRVETLKKLEKRDDGDGKEEARDGDHGPAGRGREEDLGP